MKIKLPITGSDQLLFSTCRIVGHSKAGTSIGTAFHFNFATKTEGQILPCLVTNKHVVRHCSKGEFWVHTASKDDKGEVLEIGDSHKIDMTNFEAGWTFHPDEEVDLCAMPFQPIEELAKKIGKGLFHINLDESFMPNENVLLELFALTHVVMVGYPIGLWDEKNNFPLLRRGTTASHPVIDFNGKSQGCVDIAAFPGSSGSPILVFDEGAYATRAATSVGTRVFLLGVLWGGPQHQADGSFEVKDIPTAAVPVIKTQLPAHLGFYVKAREMLPLKEALFAKLGVK